MACVTTLTQDRVRHIILSATERKNALDAEMAAALLDAVEAANADPDVGIIVFRSAMRSGFSSGPDMQALQTCVDAAGRQHLDTVVQTLNEIIVAIHISPKITLVAFHGYAFGGGLNLFLACDLRLGVASTRFVERFFYLGVTPDLSSSYFLPRLVGATRTMELLLTGRMFTAKEAERWGLLTETVEKRGDLALRIDALCEQFATADLQKIATFKRLLHAGERANLVCQLDDERAELVRCFEVPEVHQRIANVMSSPFSMGASS